MFPMTIMLWLFLLLTIISPTIAFTSTLTLTSSQPTLKKPTITSLYSNPPSSPPTVRNLLLESLQTRKTELRTMMTNPHALPKALLNERLHALVQGYPCMSEFGYNLRIDGEWFRAYKSCRIKDISSSSSVFTIHERAKLGKANTYTLSRLTSADVGIGLYLQEVLYLDTDLCITKNEACNFIVYSKEKIFDRNALKLTMMSILSIPKRVFGWESPLGLRKMWRERESVIVRKRGEILEKEFGERMERIKRGMINNRGCVLEVVEDEGKEELLLNNKIKITTI